MKKIKITEQQAKMLKELNKKKVLKITKEQYELIVKHEQINENSLSNPITREFNKNLSVGAKKDISKIKLPGIKEMYEEFINELYSINEGTEKKYEKLTKLMESAGLINKNKIVKEKFKGDKNKVKEIIGLGLFEIRYGRSEYSAMELMEEALNLSKDMSSDAMFKELVKKWLEKNDNAYVKDKYLKGDYKNAWLVSRNVSTNLKEVYNDPTQDDTKIAKGLNPKNNKFSVIYKNDEMVILIDQEKNKYYFNYYNVNNSEFDTYADKPILSADKDEDGDMDIEYGEFDITDDTIENYVNDNYEHLKFGPLDQDVDITLITPENKNDIISFYPKETTYLTMLLSDITSEMDETTTASSSGAFVGKLNGNEVNQSNVFDEISEQGIGSVGAYDTPAFTASKFMGTKGKNGKAPVKTTVKPYMDGAKEVKIKEKCKKFPYCNQGPDAIAENIAEKTGRTIEEVKQIINNFKQL